MRLCMRMRVRGVVQHVEQVEEIAAIKMQALFRGKIGRRQRAQEAIQDLMEVPPSLASMRTHAYGTAVCRSEVHFEHSEFAFGSEELVPVKIVGPLTLFELVVQILVGAHTEVMSTKAEAEAMRFDYLMTSMSPLASITLSSADRHIAGIPVQTEYYAYLYPVSELDHLRCQTWTNRPTPRAS